MAVGRVFGSEKISGQSIVPAFAYVAVIKVNNLPLFDRSTLYVYSLTPPQITFNDVSINIQYGTFHIPGRQDIRPLSLRMYSFEDVVKNINSVYKQHIVGGGSIDQLLSFMRTNSVSIKFLDISSGSIAGSPLQFNNVYVASFSIENLSWKTNDLFDINMEFYVNSMI